MAQRAPLLAQVGPNIAHPQIRNRGTFGGSMAHADPAAHWPVASLALGARFHLRKQGKERWVNGEDFFTGLYSSALEPDEMLVEVEVKGAQPGMGLQLPAGRTPAWRIPAGRRRGRLERRRVGPLPVR